MSDDQLMMNRVHCMDCIEFLKKLPDNSVDSCVTDPPYGLEFMGKEWDRLVDKRDRYDSKMVGEGQGRGTDPYISARVTYQAGPEMQQWHYEWAKEVLRVLKPGAHLLAFSGCRTYHRLACAIEDAGFEIRDQILHWGYGSGFPKGLNVEKSIDQYKFNEWLKEHPEELKTLKDMQAKLAELNETYGTRSNEYKEYEEQVSEYENELRRQAGAKREVVGRYVHPRSREKGKKKDNSWGEKSLRRTKEGYDILGDYKKTLDERLDITGAASDEAKQWQGWNTQLKPSHEPIVLARKPISEKSIVENVLRHGTGAINIDACRIAVNPDVDAIGRTTKRDKRQEGVWEKYSGFLNPINPQAGVLPTGRYPANLILSHHPDCRLIKEGDTKTVKTIRERDSPRMGKHGIYGKEHSGWSTEYDHDSGNLEVWACVEGCPVRILNEQSGTSKSSPVGFKGVGWKHSGNTKDEMTPLIWQKAYTDIGGAARFFYCAKPSVAERSMGLGGKRNVHITVKPLEIMRWLVRLITPRGGIVLDPFLGSGTTAIAAENEGCDWLGCDNNESYCKIAEARIKSLGGTQTRIIDFQDDGRKSETMKNEEKEIEI